MSRLNDVGGAFGFGPVEWDSAAPIYKRSWEAQSYATVIALVSAGHFTLDEFRHAMERIPPEDYYATSYYGRFVRGLTTLLLERGLLHEDVLVAAEASVVHHRHDHHHDDDHHHADEHHHGRGSGQAPQDGGDGGAGGAGGVA
jgi:nitrile hydratase